MTTNWEIKKIGEVCEIGAGNSAPQKKELFDGGRYPFFRTSDVGRIHFGVIDGSTDKLNEVGIKQLHLYRKGTLLFPKSGASTFLNHRVLMDIDGYVSSHLATLKAKSNILDDRFLLYFSSTIDARNLMQDQNYPSLRLSDIQEISILLPSLLEQKCIVKVLDEVFEKTTKAKENAEKNLQNAGELFESYLQSVFTNLGEGWEEKKIGEVCEIIAGQSPEGKYYNNTGKGLPFYQGKKEFTDKIVGKPTTWTTSITKEARQGDVLMSVRAPVGPVNFTTEKICIGRGLAAIRATKLIDKEFLFNFLLKHEKEIVGNTGAVFNSISKMQIENILIPLPPISEQRAIVTKIDALSAETKKLEVIYQQKLNDLEELKKSILQKAFKGELIGVQL